MNSEFTIDDFNELLTKFRQIKETNKDNPPNKMIPAHLFEHINGVCRCAEMCQAINDTLLEEIKENEQI